MTMATKCENMLVQLDTMRKLVRESSSEVFKLAGETATAFTKYARGSIADIVDKVTKLRKAAKTLEERGENWQKKLREFRKEKWDDVMDKAKRQEYKKQLKESCDIINDYLDASDTEASFLMSAAKWYQGIFDLASLQGVPLDHVR
jgi:hypothetical protein